MEMPTLKLLAEGVRVLLQESNIPLGHNQSLDLVAAIPGLRSWPEVLAFPARVEACELDLASVSRLSFRVKKKFNLEFPAQELLASLAAVTPTSSLNVPHIWPTGPAPGVYVTTSADALNALLDRYAEATDGELIYAERAGSHWEGSIALGEDGLWSGGLPKLPSGTLIVVGPVRLNEQEWDEGCIRMARAALCAHDAGHRVAVLLETPSPETLFEDVALMVEFTQPDGSNHVGALAGIVSEEGEFILRTPFAKGRRPPISTTDLLSAEAIPANILAAFRQAIEGRKSGLILVGSESSVDNPGVELVLATLSLTSAAGPAARIMPRHRSTPAKDWMVPDAIAKLPFLPSVEAAYDQGYRRMVISPGHTDGSLLTEFAEDVLFIGGVYGSEVDEMFIRSIRAHGRFDEVELLPTLLAVLGVKAAESNAQFSYSASDLYVRHTAELDESWEVDERAYKHIRKHRIVRWEDELNHLLDAGTLSEVDVEQHFRGGRRIKEFLAQRKQ